MHPNTSRVFAPDTNTVYDVAWLLGAADGQVVLARSHRLKHGRRLRCACHPAAASQQELVVRLVKGHYYIARMPDTGHLHDRFNCPMFSEDLAYGGSAEYHGALRYRGEIIEVKTDFPLHAFNTRSHSPRASRHGDCRGATRGSMGLAGLLSLLWTHAGLNNWQPGTVLPWVRVRGRLLGAAESLFLGKRCLGEHLFVQAGAAERWLPEPPATNADWHDYKLVLFKLTATIKTPVGGAYFKAASGDVFLVTQSVLDTLRQRYARPMHRVEAADDNRQSNRPAVICFALAHWKVVRGAPCLSILQAALQMINWRSIPVESGYELQIADLLVEQERRFTKPMRFDASAESVFPDFVLSDAGADAVPMEVYGVSGNPDYEARKQSKRAFYQQSGKAYWEWTPPDPVPPFPPKRRF